MSIRSEIETKLTVWAATQSLTISYENVPFIKPISGSYLEIYFLDSVVLNPDVSAAREREIGSVQINVCTKQNPAKGVKAGEDIAAGIKALFPVLPKTATLSIEKPLQTHRGIDRDDGFRVIPTTLWYRAER